MAIEQAEDFRAESKALHALLADRTAAELAEPTLFKGWTTNDVLQHLHFWNQMAGLQLTDAAELARRLADMTRQGGGMRAFENAFLDGLSGPALRDAWVETAMETADLFSDADPKARLKWAGPDMSARSSITARLMETWAHGQEVYDHFGVHRINADRIRNIVILGVNTFAWTYRTRKETPPGEMPYLVLTAPSGAVWTFGEERETSRIEGLAEEFCQVVTQTRNIADTKLKLIGPVAEDWMSKAQCFAGPPETPPAPGSRRRRERSDA